MNNINTENRGLNLRIDYDKLATAFKAISKQVAANDGRPILQGLMMRVRNRRLELWTCNGFAMNTVNISAYNVDGTDPQDTDMIPLEAMPVLPKASKGERAVIPVIIECDGKNCTISHHKNSARYAVLCEKAFDVDAIMRLDVPPVHTVTLNAHLLANILANMPADVRRGLKVCAVDIHIDPKEPLGPVRLEVRVDDHIQHAMVLPVRK